MHLYKALAPCQESTSTRPAHQYAPALCAAWGLVVRAAYEEWDWQTYLQEHSALKALEHCWADMDAPPWPVDSTLVATEPSIAGGHGVQDSTCPRCGLDPQLHAGHSCPMCGGGGSILSLQKDPTLAPKGASPQKDCTPTPTGASPQKDCTPAPTSKVGGEDTLDPCVLAERYLEKCQEPYGRAAVKEATEAGNILLLRSGSVPEAAYLVNQARLKKQGEHLEKARDGKLQGLSTLHASYLKQCVEQGVPSRAQARPGREKAKNHGSVRGYEEEMLQKAWKDASFGAVLLCSTETSDPKINQAVEDVLARDGVAESPLGRVPKQNPDRTISVEGRPINDMRARNSHGSKYDHPPAAQPRHRAVVRQSLWWRVRHPKVPQRCAKRDVPRAFKWHFLRPRDVPEFCTRVLGIIILSLVMVFGWVGAPGEFVIWATAAQKHHGSFRPAWPQFNDVVPYTSRWLMDDGVVVEPMVGNRVFRSLAAMDKAMEAVWGPGAINLEKLAEEGEPASSQLLWGLHLDFEEQTVVLPEPKRMKAKYLLREPQLQRGCQRVQTKLLRELAGSAQYWAVSAPELAPYLPVFYRLLQREPGDHEWVRPRGSEAEVQAAWEEFWDALDWVRLQMEKPWGSSFRVAFGKLLPLRERLAIPGMARATRFVGGDATLHRLGAADWKDRVFHAEHCSKYLPALRAVMGEHDNLEIIGVLELLTFIVLAAARKGSWQNQMVLYVTDNMNVKGWLNTRRSSNRYVRALLLLLQRLEAEEGFTVDGTYVRTYHNTLNDWLTREDEGVVAHTMEAAGWTRLQVREGWEELLREAVRPSLKLPGETGSSADFAIQLAAPPEEVKAFPRKRISAPVRGSLHQLRTHSGLLSFEVGWSKGGGTLSTLEEADWIVGTLSHDPYGFEAKGIRQQFQRNCSSSSLLIDSPQEVSAKCLLELEALQRNFSTHGRFLYQTSHLGSFFARKRCLWSFGDVTDGVRRIADWRSSGVNACWLLPLHTKGAANGHLSPPQYVFTREPNIITTGDKWLPRPVGHLYDKSQGKRHLVHSAKGVACGPRLKGDPLRIPGGTLIDDGTGAVRPLLPAEVWEMQGGSLQEWEESSPTKRSSLMVSAVREPGWQVALVILQLATSQEVEKSGVLDPDEILAHEQLEVWLKAWGRNPAKPSEELYLTSWKAQEREVAPTSEPFGAGTLTPGQTSPQHSGQQPAQHPAQLCRTSPQHSGQQPAQHPAQHPSKTSPQHFGQQPAQHPAQLLCQTSRQGSVAGASRKNPEKTSSNPK